MRYPVAALLIANLAWIFPALAAEPADAVFTRLEQQWLKAIQMHDTAFLDKFLADDFIDVSVHGEIRHKADELAAPVSPASAVQQLSDLHVRTFGNTAVVTGLNTLTSKQPAWTVQVRFTDVFAKHDGRWQAVSAQETLVHPAKN